jgi:hypothetical protein
MATWTVTIQQKRLTEEGLGFVLLQFTDDSVPEMRAATRQITTSSREDLDRKIADALAELQRSDAFLDALELGPVTPAPVSKEDADAAAAKAAYAKEVQALQALKLALSNDAIEATDPALEAQRAKVKAAWAAQAVVEEAAAKAISA